MIIGQRINASMFDFFKDEGYFSQEISSLGTDSGKLFLQLYDDACDEGFVMVSDRTQGEVPFYLSSIEKSAEGELQCWHFKSATIHQRTKNLTVTVFND